MKPKVLTKAQLKHLTVVLPAKLDISEAALDSPFFRVLASTERDVLTKLITERRCMAGEVVLQEGDLGHTLYIIWSGRVAIVKGNFDRPTVLGYRGVGEIIGEMALISNRPRSASIIALEPLRLLAIKRRDFQRLLEDNPAIGRNLLKVMIERLQTANEALESDTQQEFQLLQQVSELQTEKQALLELQHLRQETTNLIVHDLRTPLSNIYTALKMLELVLPEETLSENRQLLDIANANAERMQRLVEDLLDVAKMEEQGASLEVRATDLKALVQAAVDRLSATLHHDDIHLSTKYPEALPRITIDPEKIDRVVVNLLDNAIKYTRSGQEISVVIENNPTFVSVAIVDQGPGVPADDRERIFERFAQIREERSRLRGFGLGLAFCRLVVEGHGGRIWVEPGPDEVGSRFVFTLPATLLVRDEAELLEQIEQSS